MSAALLALDLGTSACKGSIYSQNGTLLAETSQSYDLQRPAPTWVEQDPRSWWRAVQLVCRQLLQRVPAQSIVGIGLSGQVPTMVLVNADGQALAPAITWQDRRADQEALWLREEIGAEQLTHWLGVELPIDSSWPPARLLWWRRHRPDLLKHAHKVLMAKDFLLAQLTGEFYSDAWSAKGMVHLLTGEAPVDYYAALDLPTSMAPSILAPTAIAGTIHAAAAALTGLRVGTPVVTGWSDALSGMAGTGAMGKPDLAFNLTGTSEIIGCSGKAPTPRLLHIPAPIAQGISVLYGPTQSGGDSLVWFAEWMGGMSVEDVIKAAERTPAGADGLLFLPYLQGERAPLWDSAAQGAFVGLRRQHGPGYGARAVMEGVAMSVRHVLQICGARETFRVAGGSSRSSLWNQIRADVTGMCVEVTEQTNATTLGAAMLTAIGTGLRRDFAEANMMVRLHTTYQPRPEPAELHNINYARYLTLYPLLKSVYSGTSS